MKIAKLKNMKKGWFIGDFNPSVLKTKDFEVGVVFREKGLQEKPHYHAKATEYNLVISGSFSIPKPPVNHLRTTVKRLA